MSRKEQVIASAREFCRGKPELTWEQCMELAERYHAEQEEWDSRARPGRVRLEGLPF